MTVATLTNNLTARAREATPVVRDVTGQDRQSEHWVGTWSASPHQPSPGFGEELPSQIFEFDRQTVRQIVRVSTGGEQVRVRLANTFGDASLRIGAARVAISANDEQIEPDTDHVVTFSGQPNVTIPPGALVLSDPVPLSVPPLAELAISIFLPEPTTNTTLHAFSFQTNYVSPSGDFTAERAMPVAETMEPWVFLTGVDVAVSVPTRVVAALGDSLTDGAYLTPDTYDRWTDVLAQRLVAAKQSVAVLNQGIGGNRILHDAPAGLEFAGQSALARFDRDVLAQPGVTHLIVFLGINDIGMPALMDVPEEAVSAGEMIAGLHQLAVRAQERGIVAIGATMTPYGGAMFYSDEGEATRQSVNDWIRESGVFDAVLDFDAVVRDPQQPTSMRKAFDAGDFLHFNAAGYQALAESIDLALFGD